MHRTPPDIRNRLLLNKDKEDRSSPIMEEAGRCRMLKVGTEPVHAIPFCRAQACCMQSRFPIRRARRRTFRVIEIRLPIPASRCRTACIPYRQHNKTGWMGLSCLVVLKLANLFFRHGRHRVRSRTGYQRGCASPRSSVHIPARKKVPQVLPRQEERVQAPRSSRPFSARGGLRGIPLPPLLSGPGFCRRSLMTGSAKTAGGERILTSTPPQGGCRRHCRRYTTHRRRPTCRCLTCQGRRCAWRNGRHRSRLSRQHSRYRSRGGRPRCRRCTRCSRCLMLSPFSSRSSGHGGSHTIQHCIRRILPKGEERGIRINSISP